MRLLPSCLLACLLLAACAGDAPEVQSAPDPAVNSSGIDLFNEKVIGSNPGCVTCHSLEQGPVLVGPALGGLADVAATRVTGMGASDYVREAIVEPDAHVVEGFEAGQMPGDWDVLLTAEQIESLVELLLSS